MSSVCETQGRMAEQRQCSGGLKCRFRNKRATSLDDVTFSKHFPLKTVSAEGKMTKPTMVALDDCSLYLTSETEGERRFEFNGTRNFEPNDKARCICHLLRREETQELTPCYDLVASPGPRFLLRSLELEDSAAASFKIPAASVPFKWEEAPGKPRPDAAIAKPHRSLQLPPRLVTKSHTGEGSKNLPQNLGRRCTNVECVSGRPTTCSPLIFGNADLLCAERKAKVCCNQCEIHSPRRILSATISNKISSSADPNSESDSESCTQAAPLMDVCFHLATQTNKLSFVESENPIFQAENQLISYVESPYNDLAPCIEISKPVRSGNLISQGVKAVLRLLNKSKSRWQRGMSKNKARSFPIAELWAPTLATHFQFIERNERSTMSEKLRLLDSFENRLAFEKRHEELSPATITKDTASSSPPQCICHCRSWKQQTELSEEHTKKNVTISKHSRVNLFNKDNIDSELAGKYHHSNGHKSPSRFLLLSPSHIIPLKLRRRNLKLRCRGIVKISRSLNVLTKAIKHRFISKKQDPIKPRTQANLLHGSV